MALTQANELLIAQLSEHQPEAIVWLKPVYDSSLSPEQNIIDFEILYCNIAYTKFMDQPKENILLKRVVADHFPDEYTQAVIFEQCCRVMETEKPLEYAYFNEHFKKYFSTVRIKVCGGVLVTTRDRTAEYLAEQEHKKVEVEKQQQAKLLNRIVETSPAGIVLYESIRNKEGSIIDFRAKLFNHKSAELTGFNIEETRDKTMNNLIAIRGNYGFYEQAVNVAESGMPAFIEYYSGFLQRWLAFSMVKFEDGILVNYIDITESKAFEQQAKEKANELDAIFNASMSAVYSAEVVRSQEGRITDLVFLRVNESFLQMFSLSSEQVIGKSLYSFSGTQDDFMNYVNEALVTDKPLKKELYYDSIKRWFEFSIAKLNNNTICVTLNETTGSVLVKQALEEAVNELKQSNKSLSEFAYIASHDLKEPLRKIRIQSNNLQERASQILDEQGINNLHRILSSVTRMETLINDLLMYSHLSKPAESPEIISLNTTVQEVINDLETTILETGAVINCSRLPEVNGDSTQLRQLFQNLLSNALKFRRAQVPPVVNISAVKLNASALKVPTAVLLKSYCCITIEDNGIGFEQEYADRIFKVFERLHGNKEYQGTGIGLAIVQKVVENHHGFIETESLPGKGSAFRIFLPA
jgi:signal transduction histidine kinase